MDRRAGRPRGGGRGLLGLLRAVQEGGPAVGGVAAALRRPRVEAGGRQRRPVRIRHPMQDAAVAAGPAEMRAGARGGVGGVPWQAVQGPAGVRVVVARQSAGAGPGAYRGGGARARGVLRRAQPADPGGGDEGAARREGEAPAADRGGVAARRQADGRHRRGGAQGVGAAAEAEPRGVAARRAAMRARAGGVGEYAAGRRGLRRHALVGAARHQVEPLYDHRHRGLARPAPGPAPAARG